MSATPGNCGVPPYIGVRHDHQPDRGPLGGCGHVIPSTPDGREYVIVRLRQDPRDSRIGHSVDLLFHVECAPEGRVPLFRRGLAREQAQKLARAVQDARRQPLPLDMRDSRRAASLRAGGLVPPIDHQGAEA